MDAEEHFEQAKAAAARPILQSEDVLDDGDRRSLEYQIILDQEAQAFQDIAWKSETNYHREIREIDTMPTAFCGPATPDALKQTALERHVDTMITLGRRYLPFGETFHNFLEGEFADAVRSGSVDLALTMIPLGKIASSIGRAVKPLAAPVVAAFEKQAIRYGARVTDKLPGLFNNPDVMKRGMMYEDHVAKLLPPELQRLKPNHPTFDFFDRISRKAVSVKSLDTQTAARLADPTQIYKSIRQNINKARDYSGGKVRDILKKEQILSKELRVGVPVETNTVQWQQVLRAMQYGKENGVEVIIEAIK
jgi:hypothetical protein